eukprot:gb/GEZN01007949.1/.p1 GENE.gb/GEZN01007949.1/~~gb/GEZN01007949.1/.p1  ORF type:complete len:409 (-),score=37.69 gb/GEZN01007949.1/:257-1381(-)
MTATDMCTVSTKAALAAGNVDASLVDSVFVGNACQSASDAPYIARHVALKSGLPIETPALTLNRLCGSGFESVIQGYQHIVLNQSSISLCAGSESMSQAPLVVFGEDARFGVKLGAGLKLKDMLMCTLTDELCGTPMGITAESVAKKYNISRADCDAYALRSQNTWKKAHDAGVFAAELAPISLPSKKGTEIFDTDEHPRQNTNLESLSKLRPSFDKNGLVTAGNASGIADGAGSVLLASEAAIQKHNLVPLARVVSYAVSGVDPSIMGIGPVPAIRAALGRAKLNLKDIDRIEINEAFAAQYLGCEIDLGIDSSKANTNGGAIAVGHPLAASGSRITAHLVHDLIRLKLKYGVGASCIGGGQGIAIVVENVSF